MTKPAEPEAWEELRAAQYDEYSQWIATGPIYVGTALAYNEGDPVPASNVKALGYDKSGQVARRGASKTAAESGTKTAETKK